MAFNFEKLKGEEIKMVVVMCWENFKHVGTKKLLYMVLVSLSLTHMVP